MGGWMVYFQVELWFMFYSFQWGCLCCCPSCQHLSYDPWCPKWCLDLSKVRISIEYNYISFNLFVFLFISSKQIHVFPKNRTFQIHMNSWIIDGCVRLFLVAVCLCTGALFACVAFVEMLSVGVSFTMFSSIYAATLSWFSGFNFLLAAGLTLIPATLTWWVAHTLLKRDWFIQRLTSK